MIRRDSYSDQTTNSIVDDDTSSDFGLPSDWSSFDFSPTTTGIPLPANTPLIADVPEEVVMLPTTTGIPLPANTPLIADVPEEVVMLSSPAPPVDAEELLREIDQVTTHYHHR